MPNCQDHDSRTREILTKSLALFSQLGYSEVNYRQIADHCGVNRTAIYHYFPNKRAVFDAALIQLVEDLAADFRHNVETHPNMSAADKLEMVMLQAVAMLCNSPDMLQSICEYLLSQRRQGENIVRKVRRHTIVVRRTLIQLSREAVQNGEFRDGRPEQIANILYSILESAALQVGLCNIADQKTLSDNCRAAVQAFKA